jgi:hypothetical protein
LLPIVASCPYSDQLLVTRKFWSPGANRPSQVSAGWVADSLSGAPAGQGRPHVAPALPPPAAPHPDTPHSVARSRCDARTGRVDRCRRSAAANGAICRNGIRSGPGRLDDRDSRCSVRKVAAHISEPMCHGRRRATKTAAAHAWGGFARRAGNRATMAGSSEGLIRRQHCPCPGS